MERLTKPRGNDDLYFDFTLLPHAIARLAAYEDTGLEPEEIMAMISPPNDPLTLEELLEMDGEPVWVESLFNDDLSRWVIIDMCGNGFPTRMFYAYFDYYEKEWLAYRRKPEEARNG